MARLRWLLDPGQELAGDWVVFGAGAAGRSIRHWLGSRGGHVMFFCDNDPGKSGLFMDGLEVRPASALESIRSTNVVVSVRSCGPVLRQLLDLGCVNVWVESREECIRNLSCLELDPETESVMDVLLVLPDPPLRASQARRVLDFFSYRFRGARQRAVAAPAGARAAYSDACPGVAVQAFDLEFGLESYHALVFARDWDQPTDFSWTPCQGVLERRIYTLQPWGQIRCTNREIETLDFPSSDSHVFYRIASRDNQSFNVFFPYGFINRDASNGPADAYGHRIAGDWRALERRRPGHKVVCVFGGSAAWGQYCLCAESFPARLEILLNESLAGKAEVTVLNFAQPGAMLFNEIQSFLIYAQRLRPEVVISHDGFNDLYFGQMDDPRLVNGLGLTYVDCFHGWAAAAHGGTVPPEPLGAPAPDALVKAYVERRAQFITIARAFGALPIAGLQPILTSKAAPSIEEAAYLQTSNSRSREMQNMPLLYERTQAASVRRGDAFVDFHAHFKKFGELDHLFQDLVHMSPEGYGVVAQVYFEQIMNSLVLAGGKEGSFGN